MPLLFISFFDVTVEAIVAFCRTSSVIPREDTLSGAWKLVVMEQWLCESANTICLGLEVSIADGLVGGYEIKSEDSAIFWIRDRIEKVRSR